MAICQNSLLRRTALSVVCGTNLIGCSTQEDHRTADHISRDNQVQSEHLNVDQESDDSFAIVSAAGRVVVTCVAALLVPDPTDAITDPMIFDTPTVCPESDIEWLAERREIADAKLHGSPEAVQIVYDLEIARVEQAMARRNELIIDELNAYFPDDDWLQKMKAEKANLLELREALIEERDKRIAEAIERELRELPVEEIEAELERLKSEREQLES